MTATAAKPIVDPEGEWLWVPASVAAGEVAAVAFARDYWPDKPCYQPWPQERLKVASYDDVDDDGQATLDEYGGDGLAMPCGADEGEAYWPIRCYPDPAAFPRTLLSPEEENHGDR